MAYFLKKSNLNKGTYLQIYESFYDPRKKNTAHRSYKALGYVHELQEKGIEDPVAFFKDEVARLNQQLAAPFSVVVLGNFRRFFFLFFRFFFRPSIFPLFTTNF